MAECGGREDGEGRDEGGDEDGAPLTGEEERNGKEDANLWLDHEDAEGVGARGRAL